jgi:hypothetical protein
MTLCHVAVASLLTVLGACSYAEQDSIEIIEAEVHSKLLRESLQPIPQSERSRVLAVRAETILAEHAIRYNAFWDSGMGHEQKLRSIAPAGATDAVVASFVSNGASKRRVRVPTVIAGWHVILAEEARLSRTFAGGADAAAWNRFGVEFDGARPLVSLSGVGWDPASKQALVIVETRCGPLCGAGFVILLQRTGNSWTRLDEAVLWVS